MKQPAARPRRIITTSALTLGLVASMGATTSKCAADPQTNSGKDTGSVVRCHSLACDVILRRASTKLYADKLHGRATSAIAAGATAEFACLLLTHELATHVVCTVGTTFLAGKLIESLKQASADGDCLKVHLQAPGVNGTWKPVGYGSEAGQDCHD